MLALELVPGRLRPRSGVFELPLAVPGTWTEPTDDKEVKEPAEVIASGCFGDHGDFKAPLSFDVDLRRC